MSGVSPESRGEKSTTSGGCLSLTEYKIYKTDGLADASTQTDENIKGNNNNHNNNNINKPQETCTRGVSTDDMAVDSSPQNLKQNPEIQPDPSPPSSSTSSSIGKTETLESLIKADASKLNSFRRPEIQSNTKLRATDMLMQLISCGSISVKDHSFGLIPSYKPRFSDSKFQSPLFSTSVMLGDLDCLPENPRFMSMRLEDKEYFSGSLVETKVIKEEGVPTLKRSSSYNADRFVIFVIYISNFTLSTNIVKVHCYYTNFIWILKCRSENNDQVSETTTRTKCIPRSLKGKNVKSEPMRSPISDGPRISSEGPSSRIVSPCPSNCSSKRMTTKKQSGRLESFREEKDNMVKIEES